MQWKNLQKPRRLNVDFDTLTTCYGKFWAEPLERGYGVTLGNALRRVILSSIPGAAVTTVRLDGVLHEFTTIPDVVEDVTNIILNIKQLVIKLNVEHAKTILLEKSGPGKATAADIQTDADVEILNPEQHIATLDRNGKIRIEMKVQKGRGFETAENHHEEDQPIGVIPIDAVFSPVRKARFSVEAARLGRETDYDRLIMEIFTNGTIRPDETVSLAAQILRDQFSLFVDFEDVHSEEDEKQDDQFDEIHKNLNRSVDELELSVRSQNCLNRANIKKIYEMVQRSEAEMLKTRNFGKKSLNEIKEVLEKMGLHFGMEISQFGFPERDITNDEDEDDADLNEE
jgi:DNA-directed RNA polymerase subunit alpha